MRSKRRNKAVRLGCEAGDVLPPNRAADENGSTLSKGQEVIVRVCRKSEAAVLPTLGSNGAAGYDLYALIGMTDDGHYNHYNISPGETIKIGTGISVEIPRGFFGAVFARSGLAAKRGLRPANCVGVIDCDYRGEVIVALHNDSQTVQTITNGDRIAQLVILPRPQVVMCEVQELSDTERGAGGFGSTDIR